MMSLFPGLTSVSLRYGTTYLVVQHTGISVAARYIAHFYILLAVRASYVSYPLLLQYLDVTIGKVIVDW